MKGDNWCEHFFKTLVKYEMFTQNLDDEVMMSGLGYMDVAARKRWRFPVLCV